MRAIDPADFLTFQLNLQHYPVAILLSRVLRLLLSTSFSPLPLLLLSSAAPLPPSTLLLLLLLRPLRPIDQQVLN